MIGRRKKLANPTKKWLVAKKSWLTLSFYQGVFRNPVAIWWFLENQIMGLQSLAELEFQHWIFKGFLETTWFQSYSSRTPITIQAMFSRCQAWLLPPFSRDLSWGFQKPRRNWRMDSGVRIVIDILRYSPMKRVIEKLLFIAAVLVL